MFHIDYREKMLHIGLRDPRDEPRKDDENGLIYDASKIYAKINTLSERIYEDFFARNSEIVLIPVWTEQGPGELRNVLEKEFNIEPGLCIGGIVAPFKATTRQAQLILQSLKENPKKYFPSEEKKMYGGAKMKSQKRLQYL